VNLCGCEVQALQTNSYAVEASEGLKASGKVVGVDEVAQMSAQFIVGFVEVAFDGGVLDGAVHPLDLTVIRYVIRRRLVVRLFPKRRRRYGEPIRDTGRREHEGAGRPPIDSGLRARARYMAAPCDFPGCAVSADQ
jgi:hypothetical protein